MQASRAICLPIRTPEMPDTALLTSLSPARRQVAFYVLLVGAIMPPLNVFIVTIALPEIRATYDGERR